MHQVVKTARLLDADPRIASLAALLADALSQEGTDAANNARSMLQTVLNNSTHSRFMPSVGGKRARKQKKSLTMQTLARLRTAGDASHLDDAHSVAVAMQQIATVAAAGLADERLRLPALSGVDGKLEIDPEIRPGTVLLSNAVDGFPGRAMFVVLGAEKDPKAIASALGRPIAENGQKDGDGASSTASSTETVIPEGLIVLKAMCVNRPVPFTVADVLPAVDMGPLNSNFVFHGGLDDDAAFVLHRHPALPGASQLTQDGSLAAGASIVDVAALVADGAADRSEFKVVHGTTTIVYDTTIDEFVNLPGALAVRGEAVAGLALAPALLQGSAKHRGEANTWYEHDKYFHQDVVWKEAMSRLGGQCQEVAELHPSVVELVRAALGAEHDTAAKGTAADGTAAEDRQ
jgi:hypothetical protein